MSQTPLPRRSFLHWLAGTGVTIGMAGLGLSGCAQPKAPGKQAGEEPDDQGLASQIAPQKLATKAELQEAKGMLTFSVKLPTGDAVPGILLMDDQGALQAFNSQCTHMGCVVTYRPNRHEFFCPCHQGRYDAQGKVVSGPPPAPLQRFRVEYRQADDSIWLVG